ncbi:hypothetical protein LUZ60_011285 [Juncus effusus]|nr:hypothetical protein LUZ60_011285 [Juncus effusus]
MAAMKGGFTFDILNYNSVSDSNNNGIATGPAGPPTPLLHEKNNFTRYHLNNCEIINLDDDLVEISLENQGIDLNKTPQPKQRRRKYVPKVFKEKKPRAPKSVTPKPGTEVRQKRKYVRKKGIEIPGNDKPIEGPGSCTPNGGEKSVEVPSSCTPNIEVPSSCTPNGVDKPIEVPSSCTPNGGDKSIEVPNSCAQNGTSGVRKPVRRSLNFSLDLNQSTNQIQEEFDRTFPPVGQKTGTNQNGTNRVQNGSGINFSGYPYPPMPNVRPNNHMINNNSMVNMPKFRPTGLMALAMKNEHLLKTLGNYTRVNNHLISTSGVKRDHSNILLQNGNNNSARAGDGQKKMRITDQNNNNNNNILHQNGTVRPNSSNPNSSSVALHNVGPTGGVFSLADIQRITEIRKRQNPQAQQMLNGTPPAFWFDRAEPGPSNPVPITNNNINNSRPSQVNQVYNKPPPVANSIQTYSEKTTTINQHSNNPSIITTEISPAQQKPEPKRRGRQKKDKQILSDPFSTTPPAKEKPGPKPRGRKPASLINSLATSALSFEATIESIIQKMKLLDINRATQNFPVQSSPYQSFAMVPYNNGMNGTMVQYENVEKKKRKFRVRVDLDPVTNHVWNLLMGKEMNEEPLDENKEKVLEEEREIFKGRIDSFIARMHLVQGDRRFSPWKGSVVDSVVGVFLTQNVSDHLSSSAFMGLVSKYPPQNRPVNPERETSLSIRSVISLRNFHKNVVTIEDFSEEKDENNSSQDSSTKCTQPHLQETNNNIINVKPAAESSPDSGPGSIEDQNSVVSSQNSVVSSQNSTEDLNGSNGSGWLYDLDPFNALHTSYTQLLQFAESDLFPDLNKVTNAMGASCSYSNNNVGFYSQNGNSDCSAFPSGTMNNLSLGYSHPHNGNNYSDSVMPNNNDKAAPETVQNAPNSNNNNNNKVASPAAQNASKAASETVQKTMDGGTIISEGVSSSNIPNNKPKRASSKAAKSTFDWDSLRRGVRPPGTPKQERSYKAADSLDYEALRRASVRELSDAIRERGMNNMLAERIKDFLERLVRDHGSVDLEWLRDVDPGKAKDYLLSVRGLGLKSVECVRLLTLHHLAFPVDTNVGRICVRLGWVPLQPLPESLQLHLLEMYPILENIQKYLWPRLCKLDQRTLYELHYQMITFGKVFCTKSKPNCNACPMRAECKHFASAFASARLALPGPEEKGLIASTSTSTSPNPNPNPNPNTPSSSTSNWTPPFHPSSSHPPQILPNRTPPFYPSSSTPNMTPPFHPSIHPHPQLPLPSSSTLNWTPPAHSTQPIIEEPASPEPEPEQPFEDAFLEEEEDPDEIPTIKLDFEEFKKNLKSYIKRNNLEVGEADMSKALVAISPEKASLPTPKLKNISRLRTEHQVYELPDNHELLAGYERREPDDPCPYLLSIWTPGETAVSTDPPKSLCISQDVNELCDKEACLRCVGIKEARRQVVRGTVLIPCRTAMRGSFPLNGTYFQVNELFADHESSRNPVECPRGWIWNLPRRTVYFGTSIPTIFKGLSTEEIQHCFWRGFVCVRGFDRATRAPRPLYARLHFPASKLNKNGKKAAKEED